MVNAIANITTASVGADVPAGARVSADDEATLAGKLPIVRVNDTVLEPDVIVTGLSPERSLVGVHDQLPEESAVAETD